MATSQPNPRAAAAQAEPKARGANRSTKVAGKLKVLPEREISEWFDVLSWLVSNADADDQLLVLTDIICSREACASRQRSTIDI